MEIGLVNRINIEEEMQQAYLDYAMSVIVARALPDARDGLKPVHRRILYAMHDMGLRPDTPYKKSARIVGEVLGKYHPHGDMAVYEAMARMAQDFSMRYSLVDGQGNFGSVDGDAPAAMRYTEARLADPAMPMLADLQKNTVDFDPNFDGTLSEPRVLPSAIPNLLVNGATGIAVGMATSIPPHNLGEVIDAIHYLLEYWEKLDDVSVEDLMQFVEGPDFPTGGIIIHAQDSEGLVAAYSTGRGRVTLRASAHLEEMERGRSRIIINELPYMTNKSSLIERIANLAREEKLEGIADLRDESDRQGMRIVIELSKTANPEAVLADLYKSTPMETTFSLNLLALVDGEPRLLGLKQALRVFVEHRLEIVRRRTQYDLDKARQRAHILEGLRVALQNLDEVISLIRKSPDAETARDRLIKRFRLSQVQAQAILDMPLRRLAALERKKIEEEYKELLTLIKELEALLRSPKKMRQVIDSELQELKATFADRRRTHIVHLKPGETKISLLTSADMKPDKVIWISVTPTGLISRSLEDRQPRLSGKDAPAWLVQASTRDTLYLVSEQGQAAAIPVHALPETENPSNGLPLSKVSPLMDSLSLAALFTTPPRERRTSNSADKGTADENGNGSSKEGYILTVSRQGMLKRSALVELPGPSASTFTLVRVNAGDQLAFARLTSGNNELLLVTANGMAIRFPEEEIRPMGLVAAGVMGIKLQQNDEIAGVELLPAAEHLFMLASDGSAKRVPIDQFSRQGRYGQGLIAWRLTAGLRVVGVVSDKPARQLVIHLARLAPKSIRLDAAPVMGRTARGQVIQELSEKDQVKAICIPINRLGSTLEATSAGERKSTRRTAAEKTVRQASPSAKTTLVKNAPATKTASTTSAQETKTTTGKRTPAQTKASAKTPTATKTTAAEKAPASKTASTTSAQETKTTTGKRTPAQSKTSAKTPTAAKTTAAEKAPASKTASTTSAQETKTTTGKRTPAQSKTSAKTPTAAKTTAAKKAPASKTASTTSAQETKTTTGKRTPEQSKTSAKTPTAAKTTAAKKAPASKTASTTSAQETKTTTGKRTPAQSKTSAKTPTAAKTTAAKKTPASQDAPKSNSSETPATTARQTPGQKTAPKTSTDVSKGGGNKPT